MYIAALLHKSCASGGSFFFRTWSMAVAPFFGVVVVGAGGGARGPGCVEGGGGGGEGYWHIKKERIVFNPWSMAVGPLFGVVVVRWREVRGCVS